MAAGALYSYLGIGSVTSVPSNIEPAVLEVLSQRAAEPVEALIVEMDPTAVIRDSMPAASEEQDSM